MNNNEIYKYLNEIETDYEETELSEFEIKKLKKFAKANSKKNDVETFGDIKKFAKENPKKKWKLGRKFAGIAAAIVLVFGGILGTNENVRAEVISYVEKFFTDTNVPLYEAKGVPEEVQKYTVNLHKTVQLQYISFVVEDVMIDGNDGYLNLIYPEEYLETAIENIYIISGIYVNGERKSVSSSGSKPVKIGDGLISDMRDFTLREPFPEDENLDLVIEFENFDNPNDKAAIEVSLSMEELMKDSKIYLVDYEIPEAGNHKIKMMKINLINPRIEMSEPDPVRNYRDNYKEYTEIIGTNDEGKIIAFTMNSGRAVRDSLGVKTYETVYKFVPKDDVENFGKISDYSIEELNNLNDTFEFQIYRSIFDKEPITGKWILQEVEILGEPFVVELGDK